MKQYNVGKRRRLAAFRTIICREQMMSAQGEGETGNRSRGWPGPCLEHVLKAANRLRFMARRFSCARFAPATSGRRAHGIMDVQSLQRYANCGPQRRMSMLLLAGVIIQQGIYILNTETNELPFH